MGYNGRNRFMGIFGIRLTRTAVLAILASFEAGYGADLVTLKSGGGISGVVESGGGGDIRIRTGGRLQILPLDKVDSIQFDGAGATPSASPAPRMVALPAGTPLVIRVVDRIEPKDAGMLHQYEASLAAPISVGGVTVAPANSTAMLQVNGVRASKLWHRSEVSLQVVGLVVNGKKIPVATENVSTSNFEPDTRLTFKLAREVELQ